MRKIILGLVVLGMCLIGTNILADTVFGPNVRVDDTGSSSSVQYKPSVAVDTSGDIYVAWSDGRNDNSAIYFAKSTDGGASFGPNVRVDDSGSSTGGRGGPSIAVDINGNIYIVWYDGRDLRNYIYFAKSTDGGASFGPNVRVDNSGQGSVFPSIAVDTNGDIYVVFHEERGNPDIYFAKSTDGGASFGPNVRVDDSGSSLTQQAMPSIAVDANGDIYVTWRDERNLGGGRLDIYFAKSTDGGNSFGRNVRVDDTGSSTSSQDEPSIAVDANGNICVAWGDYRNGNKDIYFAKSTDAGASFGTNIRVDDTGSSSSRQAEPSIAVDTNGNINIAWRDNRNDDYAIYFTKSIDGGASFASNVRVDSTGVLPSGGQYKPSVAVDADGDVYVVWGDERNGNSDIYFARGTGGSGWTLNMTMMRWHENEAPYYSTGAATCQMILNYIRDGAGEMPLTQDEIYEYARDPEPPNGIWLTPDEVDKTLGHFDPYDYLVSNWADSYDSLPCGNPYQGYNYTIDTYDPSSSPDAMNEYMRDICHWMAYTVTQEDWWDDGELVARPNTPAAVPIYGTYHHWVAIKGCVTSEHPCPEPHTNPWNTPDFTVYGFWIKDPLVTGIGRDTYVTAAECEATYFQPLATSDDYDGLFLQVAEPPAEMSTANIEIPQPTKEISNLEFVGIDIETKDYGKTTPLTAMSLESSSMLLKSEPAIKKQSWRDLVDQHLLTDSEAVAAFEGTKMKKPILVNRLDMEDSDYCLVPFGNRVKGKGFLTSGVIILDANEGYFKEASWTENPEKFLKVGKRKAIRLIRRHILRNMRNELRSIPRRPRRKYIRQRRKILRKYRRLIRYIRNVETELVWQPNSYSTSPYKPYWKIDINGYVWYVTQEGNVIPEVELSIILDEIEANRLADET